MNTDGTQWISLPDAAVQLRVTYQRAYYLMLEGKLGQTVRRGRNWFVSEVGLKAYLERRQQWKAKHGQQQRRV